MIHINLNMIFYTHVEHCPSETIYITYCIKKTNPINVKRHEQFKIRNWVCKCDFVSVCVCEVMVLCEISNAICNMPRLSTRST